MKALRSIGEVSFGIPDAANAAGWRVDSTIGSGRVKLLRKAMQGEELPEGWFLVAQRGGGGWERITRAEVDWETSGLRPEKR